MEQTENCCSSVNGQLPPWSFVQNLNGKGLETFHSIHWQHLQYRSGIPEVVGRYIQGCYHGWVILSDTQNATWSLWNPVTSNIIRLPTLIHKDGKFWDIRHGCLSSPPDDSSSILLLTRAQKLNFVFCKVDRKRKKSRWIEMSYANQLMRVGGADTSLYCLTWCNGKVYALAFDTLNNIVVINIDIVVKGREVVITLMPFRMCPYPFFYIHVPYFYMLTASCTELFCVIVGFDAVIEDTLSVAYLFKMDMTSTTLIWEEMKELKETILFVDLSCLEISAFYNTAISSEVGGYIHVLGGTSNRIHSFHVKYKTVSLSLMPSLLQTTNGCRLEGDKQEGKRSFDNKQEEDEDGTVIIIISNDKIEINKMIDESRLLSIPFHVLEMIMEFCIGVEYLKFRATCKVCHFAAPLIQWRNKSKLKRLHTYSLASPWLIVLEQNQGIMSFTDPVFDEKYFMKTFPIYNHDNIVICCSRYGWLLLYSNLETEYLFFNPFTSDVRKLPTTYHSLENLCFSAPPTSPDCTVVGFTTIGEGPAYILHVDDADPLWHRLDLDYGGAKPYAFCFPTFNGRDLYALCNKGELVVFKEISEESFSWEVVVADAPKSRLKTLTRYFLVKRDQHLILVTMGENEKFVEVFQLDDSTKEWKKLDCLGRHVIYICGATCLCIEAKTPKMQNKIYFPQMHSKNEKIVFYSLETRMYHTFDGENIEGTLTDFVGTKHHLYPHVWIEPSWI